jgi:hypothetical protein
MTNHICISSVDPKILDIIKGFRVKENKEVYSDMKSKVMAFWVYGEKETNMKSLRRILAVLAVLFAFTAALSAQAFSDQSLPNAGLDIFGEPDGDPARTINYWDGSASTDWHTASNWSLNHVPTGTEDVVIPDGLVNYPEVSGSAECNNLLTVGNTSLRILQVTLHVHAVAGLYGLLELDWSGNDQIPILRVDGDLNFHTGASVNVTQENAGQIWVQGNVWFNTGSNVSMNRGVLRLRGTGNSYIRTDVPTTINDLYSGKDSTYLTGFHHESAATLTISGNIVVQSGSSMNHYYSGTTILKGNLNVESGAFCALAAGTLSLEGIANSSINLGDPGNYVHNLRINKTGIFNYTVTLHSDLDARGNLVIDDGILDTRILAYPSNFYFDLIVGGDWDNNAGTGAFKEYSAMSVTLNGAGDQTLSTETFSNLILDKSGGAMIIPTGSYVSCTNYDWEQGGLSVTGGTFTAQDLADNGIYGAITLSSGTIDYFQDTDAASRIDLNADLTIHDGTFNVHGGGADSQWPHSSGASIEMSSGTLDFKDRGILITTSTYSFDEFITGGTIRVAGDLIVDRTDFTPAGGSFEMAGGADAEVSQAAGAYFETLIINKQSSRTNIVTATSNLDINGSFSINAGSFTAPAVMNVNRHWYNFVGEAAFNEGTGKVVFDGYLDSEIVGEETFCEVELDKSGASYKLLIGSGRSLTCDSWDWNEGILYLSGGAFTALDLVDNGISGNIYLQAGTIDLHQDPSGYIDLLGSLTIISGTLNVYGGSYSSRWPYGEDASIHMIGGVLDVKDQGININSSPYSLSANVSGGTIRTTKSFIVSRNDFYPAGGTVEFYGADSGYLLSCTSLSWLRNILINKSSSTAAVVCTTPIPVKGNLDIAVGRLSMGALGSITMQNSGLTTIAANGTLDLAGRSFTTTGDILVDGVLQVDAGAGLYLSDGNSLTVNSGGDLSSVGTSEDPATVSHNGTGYYALNIESGGIISAGHAIFEYMDIHGVNVKNGAIVTTLYDFDYCTFRSGDNSDPAAALLTINNPQNLTITGALFPNLPSPAAWNVAKTINQGSVILENWSGDYGGPAYENDPFARISWEGGGTPVISDLNISYIQDGSQIRLDWTYPLPVTEFRIYRGATPDGAFTQIGTTTNNYWSQPVPGNHYFYRVTAVVP